MNVFMFGSMYASGCNTFMHSFIHFSSPQPCLTCALLNIHTYQYTQVQQLRQAEEEAASLRQQLADARAVTREAQGVVATRSDDLDNMRLDLEEAMT